MKRILNGYVKNNKRSLNRVAYNKKTFMPFVDERDHLGNLIDSQVRTELGGQNYIKKLVIFRPNKNKNHMEFREDIPRRWLEQVAQSDGQISERKGSFDGVLTVGGVTYNPYADNATNLDMAMSDGFKNIETTSLQSPGAATNFTKVSYTISNSDFAKF